jgi:hypothetical protein
VEILAFDHRFDRNSFSCGKPDLDGTTSGAQQIYEPGHAPEVTWILPDEDPDDL